jgi:hypothetical protein
MNYVTFTRRGHPRASVESMRERGEHNATRAACGAGSPLRAVLGVLAAALLAACNGGGSVNIANSQNTDPATVDYPIFYVKHTVPTTTAGTLAQDDLRIMQEVNPSADLYMRAAASPSAAETNITARITAGASWDVKDVDTSADGTLVIFAMRGPLAKNQQAKDPPSWRIWQYTIATDTLAPVINPADDPDPPTSMTSHRTTCRTDASCSRPRGRTSRRVCCSIRAIRSSRRRMRTAPSRPSCSRS